MDDLEHRSCPPCTLFSAIQALWNFKRMDKNVVKQRWDKAVVLVDHAMACAEKQVIERRRFLFEHPASATSWGLPSVVRVSSLPGVQSVVFDQCLMGLCSKEHKTPIRKRTRLLTNCPNVIVKFKGLICKHQHYHQVLEGVEGGVKRNKWAQRYPAPLVDAFLCCV